MRILRSVTPLVGLATTLTATAAAVVATGAPAHAQGAVVYAALGDSYSSGVGSDDYLSDSGVCLRSALAYPELYAAAVSPASFTFAACGGATTSTVATGQLSALSAATTLVSITVGGNDVGFAPVVVSCLTLGDAGCQAAVAAATSVAENELPGELDALYAHIAADAPHAKVVVLGYPLLFDTAVSGTCGGLDLTSRQLIDNGDALLNSTIATEAATYGFTFTDVRGAFAGHEICDADPWLHAWDSANVTDSFHPTPDGQADGYLPALEAAAA